MSTDFTYGTPGELEGQISEAGPVREWIRATCPVCGREYLHVAAYRPETCMTIECTLKLREMKGGNGHVNKGSMEKH